MPFRDVPSFIAQLRSSQTVSRLEWLILTTTRVRETLEMPWCEVDLVNINWNSPAERMKEGNAHSVTLTNRMIEILSIAQAFRTCEFVWPTKYQR